MSGGKQQGERQRGGGGNLHGNKLLVIAWASLVPHGGYWHCAYVAHEGRRPEGAT